MNGKKIGIIVGSVFGVLAAIGLIVLFVTQMPRFTKRIAVEKTIFASLTACQEGDLDGFLKTIDPQTAGNVTNLLDEVDDMNIVVRQAINMIIDFINDSVLEQEDDIQHAKIEKLDRDAIFTLVTGMVDADITELTRARNVKVVEFETTADNEAHIVIYFTVTKNGTERDNYMEFFLRYYRERDRWCIVDCDDEQGWLQGLKLLLKWK